MSTELKAINATEGRNQTFMTRFSGGKFGACIQLTRHQRAGRFDSINFTKEEALATAAALIEFVNGTREQA